MNKNNPSKVPEGYFASLEESILKKTIYANDSASKDAVQKVGEVMGKYDINPTTLATDKELDITPHLDINPHNSDQEVKQRGGGSSLWGFAAGFAVMVLLAWGGFSLMIGGKAVVEPVSSELVAEVEVEISDEAIIEETLLMNLNEYELIDLLFENDNNSIIVAQDLVDYMSIYEDIDILDFENL